MSQIFRFPSISSTMTKSNHQRSPATSPFPSQHRIVFPTLTQSKNPYDRVSQGCMTTIPISLEKLRPEAMRFSRIKPTISPRQNNLLLNRLEGKKNPFSFSLSHHQGINNSFESNNRRRRRKRSSSNSSTLRVARSSKTSPQDVCKSVSDWVMIVSIRH